jgi:hypothetical protein
MKILAFGHRKRVGKDTAGKFLISWLVQNTKLKVERVSFGDQVKLIAYYENHPEKKEQILPPIDKSPRQIWEELGAHGRSIHSKVWVEMAMTRVDSDTDIVVITDLRDPEEAQITKDYNGFCIRIERNVPWGGPMDYKLADYDKWDATIDNNGTRKDLNNTVVDLARRLLGV